MKYDTKDVKGSHMCELSIDCEGVNALVYVGDNFSHVASLAERHSLSAEVTGTEYLASTCQLLFRDRHTRDTTLEALLNQLTDLDELSLVPVLGAILYSSLEE